MPMLKIPTPLRTYTNGQNEIVVHGTNVGEAMQNLVVQFPSLKPHLYNSEGNLRPFVNLFLRADNIKNLQGLATPLAENDILLLIPSIAGGD